MIGKIRIGICGYGNIGKGVECAIEKNKDLELVAIFSRRDPSSVNPVSGTQVVSMEEIETWKNKIDVMILCGGSAKDIPVQGPQISALFNTVDSFDTHSDIPMYLEKMNLSAKSNGNTSVISAGWDPGLFSLTRAYSTASLPDGTNYTFWGKGVSQGHSDAIRQIKGVKNAIQYTIPVEKVIETIRNGETPELSTREKHLRECFVVIQDGEDKERIENEIKTMPKYFSDYDTTVNFVSEEELKRNHSKMPHGGFVIRSGKTSEGNSQVIEYKLKLDSNPEFTASILVAYARACYRLNKSGQFGAFTVLDIPPYLLCEEDRDILIKNLV